MNNIKHTGVNVNRILDMLDADVLNDFALKTNVDFHARKLKGQTILKLYLQGIFLYGNKLRGCFITTVKIVHKKNASAKGEDISK
ncbi:hypothetical protein, partial [Muribaculum intestinale]|uniref:hypothetical protein n=3 Tax=Muribaculum intestinale TaxID=1796646 RepID=UPI0035137C91